MKTGKEILILFCVFSFFFLLTAMSPNQAMGARAKKAEGKAKVPAANARFDVNKMGDMSDFDPSNPVIPTGDTIKIAVVGSFSGPGAALGEQYFTMVQWVAHDYNKRGASWLMGRRSWCRSSRPIICPDLTSVRRSVSKWPCRKRSTSCGAPTAATW